MNPDNLQHYKIWAPDDAEWTAWAKPVLFAEGPFLGGVALRLPGVSTVLDSRTMMIVDLPGRESVEEALAYARVGYRPVPLYNGTAGQGRQLVDARELKGAVFAGTEILKTKHFSPQAPPVFMLDSNRMNGARYPGAYDNRWSVFPQDMPSAQYLKSKGIRKIIIRIPQNVRPDLERVLYTYQRAGIPLYVLRHSAKTPHEFKASKQRFFAELGYRFKVIAGLKRNATGGFGGKIPDAYDGSSGGRFYGYG